MFLPFWVIYKTISESYSNLQEIFTIIGIIAIILLIFLGVLFWIRKMIQKEDLPKNFLLCLLPWFIPLYYTLLVTFTACLTNYFGWEQANLFLFFSQSLYFAIWILFNEHPLIIFVLVLPLVISIVTACIGYYKITRQKTPSKNWYWYLCAPALVLGIGIFAVHMRSNFFN